MRAELRRGGLSEVDAVTAATWLQAADLLRDSESRRARPEPWSGGLWSFFADPDRYRVGDTLAETSETTRGTGGLRGIQRGDRGLIWRGRSKARPSEPRGAVALVEILSDPEIARDTDDKFWPDPGGLDEPKPRVRLRVIRLQEPVWFPDPVVASLKTARAPGCARSGPVLGIEGPGQEQPGTLHDKEFGEADDLLCVATNGEMSDRATILEHPEVAPLARRDGECSSSSAALTRWL